MKSLLAQAQHQFALSEGGQIVVTHGDPVPKNLMVAGSTIAESQSLNGKEVNM